MKDVDVKVGKLTDGTTMLRIPLDKKITIGEVIPKLWMYLSYIIKETGNACVLINEKIKEVMVLGDPDTERIIQRHGDTKAYDMDLSDFIDSEDNPFFMQATEQMIHFILTYYLRLGTQRFLFILESKTLKVGIADWYDYEVVSKMLESIKKYDTNKQGLFWKREWVRPEQLDKAQGVGKT